MRRIVAAFLLLLLAAAGAQDFRLHLTRGEYGELHVGNPGRGMRLRLRWDLDEVVLLGSDRSYTNSYTDAVAAPAWDQESQGWVADPARSVAATELFYFGARCLRLPVAYVPYLAGSAYEPTDVSERVAHEGLLGLGPASPLWRHWTGCRWTSHYLDLLGSRPSAPPSASALVLPMASPWLWACPEDGAGGGCVNATLRHALAWSELEPSLYERLRNRSARTDAPARFSLRAASSRRRCLPSRDVVLDADCAEDAGAAVPGVSLWPQRDVLYDANDAPRSSVRYLTRDELDHRHLRRQARAEVEPEQEWEDAMHLGRRHLRAASLTVDLLEQSLVLAQSTADDTELFDYLWGWLAAACFFLAWYPGCYEQLHRARARVPFDWVGPGGAAAAEHPLHAAWTTSRGALVALFVLAHFGLRARESTVAFADAATHEAPEALGAGVSVAYWLQWGLGVALPCLLVPWYWTRHARFAAESLVACAMPSAFAYAMWLMLCSSFAAAFNPLLMLFCAAFLFLASGELALRLLSALCAAAGPLAAQGTPPRRGGVSVRDEEGAFGQAWWPLWALLQLGYATWFFAYLSMAVFFDRSWSAHPDAALILAGTAAATWCVGVLVPFASEQLALQSSAARGVADSISASLAALPGAAAVPRAPPSSKRVGAGVSYRQQQHGLMLEPAALAIQEPADVTTGWLRKTD